MGLDPATLSFMGMIGGTALGAYGQYQSGQDEAAMDDYNAKVQQREAQNAEQRSIIESRRQAQDAARKMGTLRAGLGASGAVTTAGAPLDLQAEQAKEFEQENLMIGFEGTQEAARLRQQAEQTKYAGKVAKRASTIQAGTTLLTGFSQAFSSGGGTNKDMKLAKKHRIAY